MRDSVCVGVCVCVCGCVCVCVYVCVCVCVRERERERHSQLCDQPLNASARPVPARYQRAGFSKCSGRGWLGDGEPAQRGLAV